MADLPPVGCLNQWEMSPKDSESEIPVVVVLLERKLEKKESLLSLNLYQVYKHLLS